MLRVGQQAAERPESAWRRRQSLERRGLGRLPGLDDAAVTLGRSRRRRLEWHRRMPPVERHHALALPIGGLFEPCEKRQVAATKRGSQPDPIEPGEVHLQLVCGAAQGRDRSEVLTGELGQLVDQ